ncbi:hypothetical protein [Salinigranum marinum]|uniref:Nmad3 family putative nucleotide modification protein n=1 Tax=Salinigranum marinum TaxID=1515595 RepID=UPI002989DFCF|nr:hypothetical protein [Salinigranum marinum]
MSRSPRAIAINVGANTNLPGVRGPIYPDGRFEYVPIPERQPTTEAVPTYADLDPHLRFDLPDRFFDLPVHLDPSFAGYPFCSTYTYGDEHGVKAGPLSRLEPGDILLFYATLSLHGDPAAAAEWVVPDWGAYLIGEFRVERAVTGDEYASLPPAERDRFATNAHVRRDPFDAKVLVAGDGRSALYDRAVPLSAPAGGTTPNELVTALSNDSGKGPWWRRRLWFDADATGRLRDRIAAHRTD